MHTKTTSHHPFFGLLTFIALIFTLYILKSLIIPILYAIILAVMIFPVQRFLEHRWRFNRLFATLCSLFIIFFISVLIGTLVYFQLNSIKNNGEDYTKNISELYNDVTTSLQDTFNIDSSNTLFSSDLKIENIIKGNFDKIGQLVTQSGSLISNIVLIPIYLFFFLYYRRFFRVFYYKLFRYKSKTFLNTIIGKIYNIQQNYLIEFVKIILIDSILNTIGLLILEIDHALFFGFFAAILLIIPYVGVIIGSLVPAVFALATQDNPWIAFGVVAIFMFIQFL